MTFHYYIKKYRKRSGILLFLLFILATHYSLASTKADSTRFSLLTCAPGEEIYTLFGHTAIRYQDFNKGTDLVFNYGLFSFNTPNFVWRFVKGETDYMLGVTDYQRFEAEYAYEDRAVWQQILNLTTEEKEKLLNLLFTNYQPDNRIYRYNFFYDNCATRPRDKIEESLSGKLIYQTTDNRLSFRDIILRASRNHSWERFGMNFCLGVETDRPITFRQEMFAPDFLMAAFRHAVITDADGRERPLVNDTQEIVTEQFIRKEGNCLFTPIRLFLLLFILIASATIYGIRKNKSLWGIDLALFAAAGTAGCVIAFLACFSEHPAVSSNYLLFAFHPLHLFVLPFFLYKEVKGKKSRYHLANAIVLTFFIVLWPIIPQYFDLAVLPLALCLLTRSVSNLILTYKKEK